jgi:hypothetical protein
MRPTRRSALIAATTLAGVLAAGCGAGSPSAAGSQAAKNELIAAISKLGAGAAVSGSLHLSATAAQLMALGHHNMRDVRAAALLAGATVTFAEASPTGQRLSAAGCASSAGPPAVNSAFAVDLQGQPIVQLRTLARTKTLYVQAEVGRILRLAGHGAPPLSRIQAQLPASMGFLRDLLAGRWISISESQLSGLQQTGGAAANAARSCQLTAQLKRALERSVSVASISTDHLRVAASVRALGTNLIETFRQVLPTSSAAFGSMRPSQLPNRQIRLDAYLSGGRLSELSLPLTQMLSSAQHSAVHGNPAVVIDFSPTAPTITAPPHATRANLQQLLPQFGQLGSGGFSASGLGGMIGA